MRWLDGITDSAAEQQQQTSQTTHLKRDVYSSQVEPQVLLFYSRGSLKGWQWPACVRIILESTVKMKSQAPGLHPSPLNQERVGRDQGSTFHSCSSGTLVHTWAENHSQGPTSSPEPSSFLVPPWLCRPCPSTQLGSETQGTCTVQLHALPPSLGLSIWKLWWTEGSQV